MAQSNLPAPTPPPLTYTYRTYLLPTSPNSPNISFHTGKFSALSLLALSTDPTSFGMSYHTECTFTPQIWHTRLTRPNIQIFICVAHPSTLPEELMTIDHGSWVGMVTQIGPTGKEAYWLGSESGCPEPEGDEVETKWHQTALWVHPEHRGKGVAGLLIQKGVDYARGSLRGEVKQARIRAFTGPQNEGSKKLYGGKGFPVTGKCTIREAVGANGNAEWGFWGRWDWGAEMLDSRLGVVMERVVKIEEGRKEGEGQGDSRE
jgi:GNAT superfamily N-acetyltransferase